MAIRGAVHPGNYQIKEGHEYRLPYGESVYPFEQNGGWFVLLTSPDDNADDPPYNLYANGEVWSSRNGEDAELICFVFEMVLAGERPVWAITEED